MQEEPKKENQEPEEVYDPNLSSGDLAALENMIDPFDQLALEEYAMRRLGLL